MQAVDTAEGLLKALALVMPGVAEVSFHSHLRS